MDTPFPLLCKPQVGGIVIFNNFAALHFIFFTKKNSSFLLKLSFGAIFEPKRAFLRGSEGYFTGKM